MANRIAQQAGQLLDAVFEGFAVLVAVTLTGQGHLGLAHQLAHTLVEPVEHDVDGAREVGQLAGQALIRQPVSKVLCRNLPGDPAEVPQRTQAALHQLPGGDADQHQQQRQGQ
ncbi:hypothetical protein WR25_08543 [Diploscapter pachys]|uniref:Uncharacterized protein n=1 Tax=Diploscapter pachys TaxID=2018661 RepID=A0A2A2K4Q0_9BILA|nr:hypothetical protein WR25_08543 [Diploscapter pachys]